MDGGPKGLDAAGPCAGCWSCAGSGSSLWQDSCPVSEDRSVFPWKCLLWQKLCRTE